VKRTDTSINLYSSVRRVELPKEREDSYEHHGPGHIDTPKTAFQRTHCGVMDGGWALFTADTPDKQVSTDFKKDRVNGHALAQSSDWTYIQGYRC
jgi:hypothetical protein